MHIGLIYIIYEIIESSSFNNSTYHYDSKIIITGSAQLLWMDKCILKIEWHKRDFKELNWRKYNKTKLEGC